MSPVALCTTWIFAGPQICLLKKQDLIISCINRRSPASKEQT